MDSPFTTTVKQRIRAQCKRGLRQRGFTANDILRIRFLEWYFVPIRTSTQKIIIEQGSILVHKERQVEQFGLVLELLKIEDSFNTE